MGENSKEEVKDSEERRLSGGAPRYYLMEPKFITFPIKTFEVPEIKKLAEQNGIRFNLRERSCCYLPKEKTRIVFDYAFDHSDCPFLDKNYQCKIYSVRPLMCKMFPLMTLFNSEERKTITRVDPLCPNAFVPKMSPCGSFKQFIQELYDAYGSSAIAASIYFDLTASEAQFMKSAIDDGRYLEMRPYHCIWKEMEAAKKTDFFDSSDDWLLGLKRVNTPEEYFAHLEVLETRFKK